MVGVPCERALARLLYIYAMTLSTLVVLTLEPISVEDKTTRGRGSGRGGAVVVVSYFVGAGERDFC